MRSWECEICKKEKETTLDEKRPKCCDTPMKRIWCTTMHGGINVPNN